ncbi:ABC transporter substrate-binding protein [Geodermatophilus sp. YIM 151500]|uniref:ABC transporter substrate-binding protein n=1 Tax=Geodermatophilus sp. YIM 151500 TaxID=2984531 RepID=UPI0021E38307|nr:ABC transporter substrate-binding protein [Geodermatophilus sp. YIM 151500]MCV2489290.1 ABC transporter substrate-binding protein [Geodermatophilus sp. YIM 151500]
MRHSGSTPRPRRITRRGATFTTSLVALSLVLTACGGGSQSADATSTGEITIGLPEEPRSLASWNAYSNDGHPILRNVEEALLNRDPESNELVGELATSWEQVDDLTWRFQLREGVTFHDGSPFDAEAAAFGLNHVLSEENAFPMRTFLGPELEARAVDEYTLEVVTEAPDPILDSRLYFVTIPSMTALQENPDTWETNPVGTGPYRFAEWNRGQNIVLEANEDWWGRDSADEALGDNEDITRVTYVFRPETEVRASLVQTGEAQFVRWLNEAQCNEAPKCESGPGVETVVLRLDTPNPALADPRIREAIALSFDKSAIIDDIMGGGELAAQIVGPSALGFNESLEPFPFDPDRAKELVAEAVADGVPVDLPLVVSAREGFILRASESIQLIADALREIGLTNVTSEMRETAKFEEAWTAGYDAITPDRGLIGLQQHGNELMDYSGSIEGYYSCDGATSAYCDPELERMYDRANSLAGDEREAALQEIAQYVYDRIPVVPIGQPNFYFGMAEELTWSPRLDGFVLIKEMELG